MIGTIIIFLLIFFVIVMGHEFGHFLIAKVNGIRVNEFAIGMGPKIAGFKKGETEYALRVVFWTVPLRPLAGKGHILRAYTAERRLSLGRSAADMELWDTEKRKAGFSCCLHSFAKGIFLCHGYR